jgi:AmmeMemoRadiSam system protein A
MPCIKLTELDSDALLDLAIGSIDAALATGSVQPMPPGIVPSRLQTARASFVTLRIDGGLRGCCGTLDAHRTLAADVWHNAWAAAFADPRFAPVSRSEWLAADVGISVLSPMSPLPVRSEAELFERLQPGTDGLVLEFGCARATFLPAVWEQVPDPAAFVGHLKRKAGLAPDFWSPRLRFQRYTSESIGPRAIARDAPVRHH